MTWEKGEEGKKNQESHCTSFVGSLEEEVNGVQRKNRHERQENSEKRERHPVINKHGFALTNTSCLTGSAAAPSPNPGLTLTCRYWVSLILLEYPHCQMQETLQSPQVPEE